MENLSSPLPLEHRGLILPLLLGHSQSPFKDLSPALNFKEEVLADNSSLPLSESLETHLCDPVAFKYEYHGSTEALNGWKKDKGIIGLSVQ